MYICIRIYIYTHTHTHAPGVSLGPTPGAHSLTQVMLPIFLGARGYTMLYYNILHHTMLYYAILYTVYCILHTINNVIILHNIIYHTELERMLEDGSYVRSRKYLSAARYAVTPITCYQ